jgi:hypothetical protein
VRTAPTVEHPGDVAALRLWLLDALSDGRPMAEAYNAMDLQMTEFQRTVTKRLRVSGARPANQWWAHEVLPAANLYYFGADVVDLMQEVASTVPDVELHDDLVPAKRGFIVFAKTWWGKGSDGLRVPVDGMVWGPTRVPTDPHMPMRSLHNSISIGLLARSITDADSYTLYPELLPPLPQGAIYDGPVDTIMEKVDEADLEAKGLYETPGDEIYPRPTGDDLWVPIGRTDYIKGWHRSDHVKVDESVLTVEADADSLDQDRRIALAAWTIIMQPGLSTQSDERSKAGEQAHRRTVSKKQRKATQSPPVRVIYLPERKHGHEPAVGTGTKLDHRVYVAPFWRQQPYGPHSSLRRPVLVRGHIRGPEGTPLVRRDVVRAKIER